jgi:hypothetical protein
MAARREESIYSGHGIVINGRFEVKTRFRPTKKPETTLPIGRVRVGHVKGSVGAINVPKEAVVCADRITVGNFFCAGRVAAWVYLGAADNLRSAANLNADAVACIPIKLYVQTKTGDPSPKCRVKS